MFWTDNGLEFPLTDIPRKVGLTTERQAQRAARYNWYRFERDAEYDKFVLMLIEHGEDVASAQRGIEAAYKRFWARRQAENESINASL